MKVVKGEAYRYIVTLLKIMLFNQQANAMYTSSSQFRQPAIKIFNNDQNMPNNKLMIKLQ